MSDTTFFIINAIVGTIGVAAMLYKEHRYSGFSIAHLVWLVLIGPTLGGLLTLIVLIILASTTDFMTRPRWFFNERMRNWLRKSQEKSR